MKIISAYTANLLGHMNVLTRSLKKFGMDHQMILHDPDEIQTFRTDWPKNRKFYCTAQGGEFMKWVDYKGIICFIDADVKLQRLPTEREYKRFLPEKGQFTACLHAYPEIKLEDSSIYKPCGVDRKSLLKLVPLF